ncbi:helix-turn-helix domain-containing protein [Kribbella sp. NBC_00889]|uniref:helix-turn-helix domain-containing protein n=1 Tax=Kribbella sp. NBC_00889 TaxID=2975974 RepID=UPI00386DEB1C|nr:helix-turn-helix transcriptional regulator [Kribbella sp. NBC_00889]
MGTENRKQVRDFLVSRRGKVTPEQAGLQHYGGNRRVPGLRREEVAMLAGLSVDYYARIEKGNISGVSETVLHGISDALQLDEAERTYLFDLARTANSSSRTPRREPARRVRPAVQRILDGMAATPALVRNGRLDILAANALGRALFAPIFDSAVSAPGRAPNFARFGFLDPNARDFYPDWALSANTNVAILRTEAGRDPYNQDLTELIGELSTRSDDFRTRWADQNVRLHRTGTKSFRHPIVGELTLDFEALELSADAGLTLTVYTPEPASPSADALNLLGSWISSATAREQPTSGTA